jgi:pimeloyl-ACP methyl ester carboxylesterase
MPRGMIPGVTEHPPTELGTKDGLAYALFAPDGDAPGGAVILHGAGSSKENHFDFARLLQAAGIAAVAFDQRGHGASEGPLGAGVLDDVATIAGLLPPGPVALRGSSMGGFVALHAGALMDAAGVVAICPATGAMLAQGLEEREFDFRVDEEALRAVLLSVDERAVAAALGERLLLLHAEGDERVPIASSRALHAASPGSELVAVPGGDHRSVQHDRELQALAVQFIARALQRPAAAS